MDIDNKSYVGFFLPTDIKNELKLNAIGNGTSITKILNKLIMNYLERDGRKHDEKEKTTKKEGNSKSARP